MWDWRKRNTAASFTRKTPDWPSGYGLLRPVPVGQVLITPSNIHGGGGLTLLVDGEVWAKALRDAACVAVGWNPETQTLLLRPALEGVRRCWLPSGSRDLSAPDRGIYAIDLDHLPVLGIRKSRLLTWEATAEGLALHCPQPSAPLWLTLILFLPLLLGTMWVGHWVANTTLSHLIPDYQPTSFWDFRWILHRIGRSF